MTHTFKYLIKIALVASALSMTHSPSFAASEDVTASASASAIDYADKLKPYCQATKSLLKAAIEQESKKELMRLHTHSLEDQKKHLGWVSGMPLVAGTTYALVKSGEQELKASNKAWYDMYMSSHLFDLSHMTETMQAVTKACEAAGY